MPRFISSDDMDHAFWAKLKNKNKIVIVIKSDNKVLKLHCVSSELKNAKAILTDFFIYFVYFFAKSQCKKKNNAFCCICDSTVKENVVMLAHFPVISSK